MYTELPGATSSNIGAPEPRVLHLTISFARGGRRDAIVTLARGLAALGVTSSVVTLRGNPDDLAEFAPAFANQRRLGVGGLPSPIAILTLRRWCREWGITVVHAHDAASQLVASMLRLVAPTLRPVMTFHRSLGFESARTRDRIRNAVSLTLVERVLTASEERRRHFLAENTIAPAKVEVIPLGIDLERFRPDSADRAAARAELGVDDGTVLLLSVGHFGEEKGIDRALQASATARAQLGDQPLHHLVLGTGAPERVELLRTLGTELLGDRVTFAGQRSDPERWFRAADILVHAPRVEAFGLVLVQAMASGTPAIASAVGGIPELVADGTTGRLVPDDDPAAMAAAIATVARDPAMRRALGEAGLAAARDRFAAARFARQHRALYREITGLEPPVS